METEQFLQKLEERAEHLEETLDTWEEADSLEDVEEPYMGIYSRQGLKMMRYEVSRLKHLHKNERLNWE